MVAHSELLLSKCAQFRDESQFIDVRLKVLEDIFPAHRIVLAANSNYFRAMFTDEMKESNQEVIELKDKSILPDVFKIVMDSIYTGDLRVNEENVSEVLAAADHLQVTSVVKLCCDFLLIQCVQLRFDVETYCRVWTIANRHGLKDLQEAAEHEMASKFKDVCESEEFLTHIGADQLCSLLSRDDLSAPSETFIFKSVMQWIKHEKEERMAVAAKVIGAVRLGLVDTEVLIDKLDTEEMQGDSEIAMQLLEVLVYNNSPSRNFAVEKVKLRSTKPVLVAVLPQTPMQYFDVETKTWETLPSMAQLTEATECSCAEYVGNYLYVAGKNGKDFVNYRYDAVSNSWETLPPILSHSDFCNRQIDSLCFLDDFYYAISGGSSCVPLRYSPAKNNWQGGASLGFFKKQCDDPNNKLTNATAAVLKSHIYVLHGLKTAIGFGGVPAGAVSPSTPGSLRRAASPTSAVPRGLGAATPSAVSTTCSVLGVGSATAVGNMASQSANASLKRSASRSSPFTLPTGGSVLEVGSAQPAVSTSESLFWTAHTPSVAGTPSLDLGVRSATSAAPTDASLLEAGSTSLAFESSKTSYTSQVWVDKAAVLHCFNPKTNKWKQQSSTCHPHYDSCLFVVNNKLYVAGGSGSSLYPSAPVEVYDEENNIWSVVEQKHIPPNKLGAVEIEGRVYFMVNKFAVDVGVRIPPGEVYQICLNDWKNLAQINKDAVLCYMPVKTESLNMKTKIEVKRE